MERRLTWAQKRLLEELRGGEAERSYEDLASAVGCSRNTVVMGMHVLERHRYVVRTRRGNRAYRYVLTDRLLQL